MRASTALKQTDPALFLKDLIPIPRTMGTFSIIITILAFRAGTIRNEPALILAGAVFLAVLSYCFITAFLLSWIHRRGIRGISLRFLTKQIRAGNQESCVFTLDTGGKRFFRLPGILLRYEIRLATKDGRYLHHLFDPDFLPGGTSAFTIPERGAYYSAYDELVISDVPGFFRMSLRIPQDSSPRILVAPKIIEEPLGVKIRAGGTQSRSEPRFLRTDNLTDHRPYIPGDDPRRINWKLYGHLGDLFVREGEPEPPPHSRLLIILDTQGDPELYSSEAGRRGADLLCENAFALAVAYIDRGIDISIGYTGGNISRGTLEELAGFLSYPGYLPLSAPGELPYSSEEQGILILALPRTSGETSALDRLLKKRTPQQAMDLVFLYEENRLESAGETAAGMYRTKPGVYVRTQKISGSE